MFFWRINQIATAHAINGLHPQLTRSMYLRLINLIITYKEQLTHKKEIEEKINSRGDY